MAAPIVEIQTPGASVPEWTDITDDVRGDVTITRGVDAERNTADPSRCQLTLANIDGRYNHRYPLSPLYGKIGISTPVRVRLDGAAPSLPSIRDSKTATSTYAVSTFTVATPTCQAGDILLVIVEAFEEESRLDLLTIDGLGWETFAQISTANPSFHGYYFWRLVTDVAEPSTITITQNNQYFDAFFNVVARATVYAIQDAAPLAPIIQVQNYGYTPPFVPVPRSLALYGALTSPQQYPVTQTVSSASWNALDSTLGTTWTTVVNTAATATAPGIMVVSRTNAHDEIADYATPGAFTGGDYSAQNIGYTHLFSIVFYAADDPLVRYVGEMHNAEQAWEAAGINATADPDVSGVLTRLGQGESLSALARSYLGRNRKWSPNGTTRGYTTLGYWPLESSFGCLVPGVAVADPGSYQVSFGSEFCPGSAGSATIDSASGVLTITPNWFATPIIDVDEFAVEIGFAFELGSTIGQVLVVETPVCLAGRQRVTITLAAATFDIKFDQIANDGTVTLVTNQTGNPRNLTSDWHTMRLYWRRINSIGSTILYHFLRVDNLPFGPSTFPATSAAAAQPSGDITISGTIPFGHVYVEKYNLATTGRTGEYNDALSAMNGYSGDTPSARIARVCIDEGTFPETRLGVSLSRITLGPQSPGTSKDIIEEAANLDEGLLVESTQRIGMRYNQRSSLYHRAQLSLDYTDSEILDKGLRPVEQGVQVINQLKLIDSVSGQGIYGTVETGAKSVLAPPDGVGVFGANQTVGLSSPALLWPILWWRLYLGTMDEPFYSAIDFSETKIRDTYANATTADALLALGFGDVLKLTNTPIWLPHGDAYLLLTYLTETINAVSHSLSFKATPASAYRPGLVGDAVAGTKDVRLQRIDSDGSTLASGITSSTTSLSVAVALTDPLTSLWTTTAADWNGTNDNGGGLYIRIDGEVMKVTAISGAASPQTFTVTREASPFAVAHSTGAEIHIAYPARIGL